MFNFSTVLHFEWDKNFLFRIIRSIKNRFGNTSELGIYEMSEKGLIEVINPSQVLISENKELLSERDKLAKMNLAIIDENYRWDKIVDQYESYFLKILNHK